MGPVQVTFMTIHELDNLDALRRMNSETMDLIATDPPSNTRRNRARTASFYVEGQLARRLDFGYHVKRLGPMRSGLVGGRGYLVRVALAPSSCAGTIPAISNVHGNLPKTSPGIPWVIKKTPATAGTVFFLCEFAWPGMAFFFHVWRHFLQKPVRTFCPWPR